MEKFIFKSQAEIDGLNEDAQVEYFKTAQKAIVEMSTANAEGLGATEKEVAELKEQLKGYDVSRMASLIEASKAQGEAVASLLKGSMKSETPANMTEAIQKAIAENVESIKSAFKSKGNFNLTSKAIIEVANATLPVAAPAIAGVQTAAPTNVNLKGTFIDSYISSFSTNLASYAYTETLPKSGDFECVLEKGVKPQIDLEFETRYVATCKPAAHMCMTEESVDDIPGLQSIATNYLRQKHDLFRQTEIVDRAIAASRAFVPGGLAACVTNPNFMDVVNAIKTDIFTTHNFVDEMCYSANIVLVNPVDFYCELVAAKDLNGLPLYPMASLFNVVTIGGCTIVPTEKIDAGDILVADMSKMRVSNYKPYSVRFGWINDDFIKNQFCIVGESRFHAYIQELDKGAFVKDTIAAVKVAISA